MDEKQYAATAEHLISTLLAEREKEMVERLEKLKNDCDCGIIAGMGYQCEMCIENFTIKKAITEITK